MIAVVQRVRGAKLSANGAVVSEIGGGLFILLGVEKGDTEKDADYIAGKAAGLRIFERNDKMDLSVLETGGQVLLVSQFTLCGDARHGRRPDFTRAAAPGEAEALYEYCAEALRRGGADVKTGVFGAHMHIDAECDGPVTIMLHSKKLF